MSEAIALRVDDSDVQRLFNKIARKTDDMSSLMSEVGDIMISSVETNFEVGGRYSDDGSWRGGSKPWKELASSTIKQRVKAGYWPGKILQRRGELAGSVSKEASSDSVEVGSNKVQAAIQNFGGKAGRGHKVTIPARPWLVVQDEDLTEIREASKDFLMGGINK